MQNGDHTAKIIIAGKWTLKPLYNRITILRYPNLLL